MMTAATDDPAGFLSDLKGRIILDEVQRAPDLFRAIKAEVDRDRKPGRFLLTGSADVMLLPNLSESLAGRMEILTLWPLSASELAGNEFSLVDLLFAGAPLPRAEPAAIRSELFRRISTGGYPEVVGRGSARRRSAWFGSYITTILQRDVRDLANVEHLTLLPRLLRLLAARATGLLNYSELARDVGLSLSTLKRYMALLEATFLVQTLPAWSANLGKRLVKSPKVILCDTGLMAHLLGAEDPESAPPHVTGALAENYVAMELKKHLGWSDSNATLYHFRERTGKEVDLILENSAGKVVAIEVKASSTISKRDLRHLKFLRDTLGDRFARGVLFYTGAEYVPFGGKLEAAPLSALAGERHRQD